MFLVFFLVGKKKEKVEFVVLVWWIEWCVYDYEDDGCEKKGKGRRGGAFGAVAG